MSIPPVRAAKYPLHVHIAKTNSLPLLSYSSKRLIMQFNTSAYMDAFINAKDLRTIDVDKERDILVSMDEAIDQTYSELPKDLFKIDKLQVVQHMAIEGSNLGQKERITKKSEFEDHPILKQKMIEPEFHIKME
jgi:hypothetical protein